MAKSDPHKAAVKQIDSDIEAWQKRRKKYQDDTEFAVIGGEKQRTASRIETGNPHRRTQ